MTGGRAGQDAPLGDGFLVDLTQRVRTAMPVYPGDPEVRLRRVLTAGRDAVNVSELHLGSHTGTHVDAPLHVDDELPDLDAVPLERFVGPAVLLDARHAGPCEPIGPEVLGPARARLRPGVVVLVVTGWSRHWDTPAYLTHPWLSAAFAEQLLATGVRTVGVDTPSVDLTPGPGEPFTGLPAHLALARAGCVIAENLTGLGPVLAEQAAGATVDVSLLPLRLAAGDGSPVRAVATVRP